MCGIAGGIGGNTRNFLEHNLHLLKNRGPDNQGSIRLKNGLTLGATRLAMTDPHPRSNQPMTDRNSNAIVFNGEIYNFEEIKKKLTLKSVNFSTKSDTEVILNSLVYDGIESIKYMEGMFAFGFYDNRVNNLILGRDYLGKKPLFYSKGKDFLIFSSQMNVLKNYLENLTICNESLSTYLRLGYLVNPLTMYQEIKSVQPGEIIEFDLSSLNIVRQSKYVPYVITNPRNISISEALEKSIKERVIGHSKFALSLSGGIDSTIIALQAKKFGLNFQAYSMAWGTTDKARYNEDSLKAQATAKRMDFPFQLVEMEDTKNLSSQISKFVAAMGEPNSNPSGVSMLQLYSRIAQDGNRLVLTGDGADEVFAGYNRYSKIEKTEKFPNFENEFTLKILNSFLCESKFISNFLYAMQPKFSINSWYRWHQVISKRYLSRFFEEYVEDNFVIDNQDILNVMKTNKVSNIMYKDLKFWLAMESNVKLDRVSMNYSIEARSPFLSETLIGVGLRDMSTSGFKILNKINLVRNYPEIARNNFNQIKMGFVSPLGFWLRNNSDLIVESINYIKKNFNFNERELDRLVSSPAKHDYSNFRFLWSLIILAKWHESEKS